MKTLTAKIFLMLIVLAFSCLPLICQTIAEAPPNYTDENAGTTDNPYQISNLANLRWLSETEEFYAITWEEQQRFTYFVQTADIDASETTFWNDGQGFQPIGLDGVIIGDIFSDPYPILFRCFRGSYDGNNHIIYGLHMQYSIDGSPGPYHFGLFGNTSVSIFHNIHLENIYYRIYAISFPSLYIGSLVGYGGNVISNCSATGNIIIEGDIYGPAVILGGLAGFNARSISNCYSKVDIFDNISTDNFQDNYVFGRLIGGITGHLYGGSITDSFYYGNIIRSSLGVMQGGLAGEISRSTIENCFVASRSEFVNARGLFGLVAMGNTVGVPFNPPVAVQDTFWDITSTGTSDPYYQITAGFEIDIPEGLSTNQMKQAETYIQAGWDFDDIWGVDPEINDGYPYLLGMPLLPTVNNSVDNTIDIPTSRLHGNYPNPFNPSTTIAFEVALAGHISIEIYNVKGQRVRALVDDMYDVGRHSVVWNGVSDDGRNVGSGVYFYRMVSGGNVSVRKMVLMK